MGIRITGQEDVVALYDSTTGLAFGRVFDSADDAEGFVEWAAERGHDIAKLTSWRLSGLRDQWDAQQAGEPGPPAEAGEPWQRLPERALVVVFDVAGLPEWEVNALEGEAVVQAEATDEYTEDDPEAGGHRDVPVAAWRRNA